MVLEIEARARRHGTNLTLTLLLLRLAQRRILYWLPDTKEKLRGL